MRARTNNLGDIIIIAAIIIVIIRNVLGTKNLGDILSERESIAHELHELLFEATEPWGVQVERVEVMSCVDSVHVDDSDGDDDTYGDDVLANSNGVDCNVITVQLKLIFLRKSQSTHIHFDKQVKDVRVPEQLMRAMAAEAEAARNARAKVVLICKMVVVTKIIITRSSEGDQCRGWAQSKSCLRHDDYDVE